MKGFYLLACFSFLIGEKAFGKPESDIPKGSHYEIPCYISTLDIPNVDSYYLNKKEIDGSTKINNNAIIDAKCRNKYYVFDPNRQEKAPPQNAFSLQCVNGGFKKVKPNEFCDQRCNIVDLPLLGFKTSTDIILPGRKTTVECPRGKTTAYGPSFEVQCGSDGLLTATSPLCFAANRACTFNGKKFPEGAKLSCADSAGLVFVVCEQSIWQQDATFKNPAIQATCKETIGEVEFKYQNLNELSINFLPEAMTVADFEDFCKVHEDDPGCKASLKSCTHNGEEYEFGKGIVLKCPGYQNTELQFQCIETWSFIQFIDPENPLARTTFGNYRTCSPDEAKLIRVIPPKSKEERSNKTLKDKETEAWKDYKEGLRDGKNQ